MNRFHIGQQVSVESQIAGCPRVYGIIDHLDFTDNTLLVRHFANGQLLWSDLHEVLPVNPR